MLEYDELNIKRNDYISPKYKKLYSTTISPAFGYNLITRYNNIYKSYDYYIIVFKNKPNNMIAYSMKSSNNVTKLSLAIWWNKLPIKNEKEDIEVSLDITEDNDDYTIYKLNL